MRAAIPFMPLITNRERIGRVAPMRIVGRSSTRKARMMVGNLPRSRARESPVAIPRRLGKITAMIPIPASIAA